MYALPPPANNSRKSSSITKVPKDAIIITRDSANVSNAVESNEAMDVNTNEKDDAFYSRSEIIYVLSHTMSVVVISGLITSLFVLTEYRNKSPIFLLYLVKYPNDSHVRVDWYTYMMTSFPVILSMLIFSFAYHLASAFGFRKLRLGMLRTARSPLRSIHLIVTSPLRTCIAAYVSGLRTIPFLLMLLFMRIGFYIAAYVYEMSNRPSSSSPNEWCLPRSMRIAFILLLSYFHVATWFVCLSQLFQIQNADWVVDDSYGLVIFTVHSICASMDLINIALFSFRSPRSYIASEYLHIVSNIIDVSCLTILTSVFLLKKINYEWNGYSY